VGKNAVAMIFAMACNCTAKEVEDTSEGLRHHAAPVLRQSKYPCGKCRSCRSIESGSHPDIIRIEPAGSFIKIAQIRDLCDTLALKPYSARLRVVIINQAHTMNPSAANALLKMLEEPPDQTILILTAGQTSDLLPTIVSRCQQIRFKPVSRKTLKAFLVANHGLADDEAMILSAMANGSFTRALDMHRKNQIKRRNWLIRASGLEQPETLSTRPIGSLLAFAEKLSKNKDDIPDSLELIKTWLRDVLISKFDPEKIINMDLTERILYASQKITVSSLISKIDAIQKAQREIQSNSNSRLTLEALMFRLARI
jgi:DNA polymerase-3 subunit delta'